MPAGPRLPLAHRLLLLAYPQWFREEFEEQLTAYVLEQRSEPRYRSALFGPLHYWWDVASDATATGLALRAEGFAQWAAGRTSRGYPGGLGDNDDRGRGKGTWTMMDAILRDARHALRGLSKNPGYALVFVVTLGLGIGANSAMFSAVNGVLLKPLPHDDGERLVYLRHSAPLAGIDNALFSVPEIEDYRQLTPSFESVAEFSALDFTVLGRDAPTRVRAGIVTGNYFEVMGLSASIGRTIGPEDDGAEAPAVIVLSHAYWLNELGGDPDVLGTTVEINGRTGTFVGVAEPAPPYPERTDLYVNLATSPHHLDAAMVHDRIHRMTEVFAKLAPGSSVESARSEIDAISTQLHAEYPEAYDSGSGFGVSVTPLKTQLTARAQPTLLLLLGTAFLVLVIACANLGNLTLTRVHRRDHELAIRLSLGGSRGALRRELLVESGMLAVAGAAVGLVMASVSVDLLVAFAGRFTSRASEIVLDPVVFGYALVVAVVASLFFAVLPALPDGESVGESLTRTGARTTIGRMGRRAQNGLVVAQIGASFVLLTGAGLMLRTMNHLNSIDPGFETAQIVSMDIPSNFEVQTPSELRTFHEAVMRDASELPGVESVAMTSSVPLSGGGGFSSQTELTVEGHEPPSGAPTPRAEFRVVTPGYFATMGIDVVHGREFTTTDVEDAQQVVLINETMARAYFGDRDPVGSRIAWTDDILRFIGMSSDYRTVVGVVADTRDGGVDSEVGHVMFNPYRQVTPFYTGSLVASVPGDPATAAAAIRDVVLRYNPEQPVVNVATIEALGEEAVAPLRLNTVLLSAFATLALLIAAVGIGGVLAFSVGSRTKEFGVRTALGAAQRQVWSGVLAEGVRLATLGVLLGGLSAVALTRFISSLLVGVPALDPITFAGVGILLAAVAVLAAWVPAARAARVSPMEALGSD